MKNKVTFLAVNDSPSFHIGRAMTVRIARRGAKKVSRFYKCTPASRRRMLRVLEAM